MSKLKSQQDSLDNIFVTSRLQRNCCYNNNLDIQWVSKHGYTEDVKRLLNDPRVDPGAKNNNAIRYASEKGHTEIVKLLLNDPRVDPSANNNWAIQLASEHGHTEVVKLLLNDPRVDPSDKNNDAIRWASRRGHTEIVKLLLNDPRVDPSANNNFAIRKTKSTVIMDMLLEKVHLPTDLNIKKYKKFLIRKKYLLKLLNTKVYDYSKLF